MRPKAQASTNRRWKLVLGVVMASFLFVFIAVHYFAPTEPQTTVDISTSPAPPRPQFLIETASIASIEASRDAKLRLFRLDVDPVVLVIDFPDLHAQAKMLNRVAALIEKADMPRDRIVTQAELDKVIRNAGGDPDSYYYGHDYRAADLARFFRIATTQHSALNEEEAWLQALLEQEGWLGQGSVGALISIPGLTKNVGISSRATIFRHELSHAVYFTDPAYVALTGHFWNDLLSEPERKAMRAFLGRDGYDTTNEDLMANEGQAYLIHTRDPRYFLPSMMGMSAERAAALRRAFVPAIPEPWLRESASAVAPIWATPRPVSDLPAGIRLPAKPPPVSAAPLLVPGHRPPLVPPVGEGQPRLIRANQRTRPQPLRRAFARRTKVLM